MTKFLKVVSVSGAAAIALSIGAVNAIGAATDPNIDVFCTEDAYAAKSVKLTPEMIAEHEKYNEVYEKAFEEAHKDERDKYDFRTWENETASAIEQLALTGDREAYENNPYVQIKDPSQLVRNNAEKRAREECEKQGLSTDITLNEYEPNRWQGSFKVNSIEGTTLTFTDPHKFNCIVSGRSGTIKGDRVYANNYKKVVVQLTYSNGVTAEKTEVGTSAELTATATATAVSGAYLTRVCYQFYLYDNTIEASGLLESAVVNLYRK